MEWSNELIMEFIHLYEKYPVLWNPKHLNHKNRNFLNDAWLKIAKEISIDVTVEVLRKKKESLMATYRTLSKKVRDSETTGSGTTDIYVPSWFAYNAIDRFIRATGKKAPSLSSDSEETQIEQSVEDETSQNEQEMLNDQENVLGQDNEHDVGSEIRQHSNKNSKPEYKIFAFPQSAPKYKRKVSPDPVQAHVTKHLKQASDALTSLTTRSQTHTLQDAPALYGQLLAAKLRRLTQRTQLILQNKIDNLVFEAELSDIDNLNTTTVVRSGATNTTPNYVSSGPIASPSNSYLSSSPSPTYAASPEPSQNAEDNVNFNVNSQSSDTSFMTYYSSVNLDC